MNFFKQFTEQELLAKSDSPEPEALVNSGGIDQKSSEIGFALSCRPRKESESIAVGLSPLYQNQRKDGL